MIAGTAPGDSRRANPGRPLRYLALAATVAGITILACWAARRRVERELDYGVPVRVLGESFRLTRGENTGIAFNLLRDSPLATWLPLAALVVVVVYLATALRGQPLGALPTGLILGGGIANLLDRLGDGRVTDYLDWGVGGWRYATFNLPDSAITVGFGIAIWLALRPSRRTGRATGERGESDVQRAA